MWAGLLPHFANNLRYANLAKDVSQVLNRLTSIESTIQTTSNEWYAMRILPYRTLDNYISGAVITFTEVSGLKRLEEQLRESSQFAESIIETMQEPLLVLDDQLRILSVSQAFADTFGVSNKQVKGQLLSSLNGSEWHNPVLRQHLQALLEENGPAFSNLLLHSPTHRPLLAYGRRIRSAGHQTNRILLGIQPAADADTDGPKP